MRILWFTNTPVNLVAGVVAGGWMQSLASALAHEGGIELHIATRVGHGKRQLQIVRQGHATYYLIPDRRNLLQKRLDVLLNREPVEAFVSEYLRVIDMVKPDLIHVFGSELEYGLVASRSEIPMVLHLQGLLHPCYYQLCRISVGHLNLLRLNRPIDYLHGSTMQNGYRTFARRVAVEAAVLEQCRYVMGRTDWDKSLAGVLAPRARYFHCDEILRVEFFGATWNGQKGDGIEIVSTISNPLYKGHDTLIETCRVLHKRGVRFNWHVIGITEQSSSFRMFYRKEKSLLQDHLRIHGVLSVVQMIELLGQASLYVHPSHIENSSNSLCEAMAIGMPVIALQVGGNASMVENGQTGMLLPDNDPFALAAGILEMAANPAFARQMADNARRVARQRHDKTRIVQTIKEIYSQIMSDHVHQG